MKNDNVSNKWKYATISIILIAIIWFGYVFINTWMDSYEEDICLENICNESGIDVYYYNSDEKICYCFKGNELMIQMEMNEYFSISIE